MTTSAATGAFDLRLAQLTALVEQWLREYVRPSSDLVAPFYDMMAYHLGWAAADGSVLDPPAPAGKRLRPILALLVCEALGGEVEAGRGPAIALELVHNFSLVHDDIQDGSHFRHHRETVWRRWGEAQAINAGDALFALAQIALAEQMEARSAAPAAIAYLNRTCLRLVEGQYLDLRLESTADVSLETYSRMIGRKTAALIDCACALGAMAAGAGEAQRGAWARIGHELGMAFQFQDDLLGVWGDPAVTGKPSGDDIRSRKKSLPIVLGLGMAGAADRGRLSALYSSDGTLSESEVAEAIAILERSGVRDRAAAMVAERFGTVEGAIREALPGGRSEDLLALCARIRVRLS